MYKERSWLSWKQEGGRGANLNLIEFDMQRFNIQSKNSESFVVNTNADWAHNLQWNRKKNAGKMKIRKIRKSQIFLKMSR